MIGVPASIATLLMYVLAGSGDVLAGGSPAAPPDSCRRSLIPPPLKDLGKDYKLRVVYFVPADAEVKAHYRFGFTCLPRYGGMSKGIRLTRV